MGAPRIWCVRHREIGEHVLRTIKNKYFVKEASAVVYMAKVMLSGKDANPFLLCREGYNEDRYERSIDREPWFIHPHDSMYRYALVSPDYETAWNYL